MPCFPLLTFSVILPRTSMLILPIFGKSFIVVRVDVTRFVRHHSRCLALHRVPNLVKKDYLCSDLIF